MSLPHQLDLMPPLMLLKPPHGLLKPNGLLKLNGLLKEMLFKDNLNKLDRLANLLNNNNNLEEKTRDCWNSFSIDFYYLIFIKFPNPLNLCLFKTMY